MAIEISNLNMDYGKNEVLKNLNLNLEDGEVVGLVGENGSGKTTLLRILAGLEKNYKGEVLISGEVPGYKTNEFVSYQPDHLPFEENESIESLGKAYERFFSDFDMGKYEKIIKDFNLDPKSKVRELSKGTRDKVQIALTLSRRAKVYLMDEPLNGVDPKARKNILNVIIDNFERGSLMVISTHLISVLEKILDRVIFIGDGKIIVNDTVDNIRQTKGMGVEEYFEEVY